MTVVAVIAMGEMGSGIAARLVQRGATVVTSLRNRGENSAKRAEAAGVTAVDDDAALLTQAELFLSIVPPDAAGEIAERFMPLIEKMERRPSFIDCNPMSPETIRAMSRPFLERGLPFVDASIIGAPPKGQDAGPRLYMSGPVSDEAETLRRLGLDARVLSEQIGDAAALKMAYAGITKGFQAIGVSMVLGAARNGVAEKLVAELQDSQPQLYAWLAKQFHALPAKAYRWDGEMREIAKFLLPEEGASQMLTGAADVYQHVAEDHRLGPHAEIIEALARFVKR